MQIVDAENKTPEQLFFEKISKNKGKSKKEITTDNVEDEKRIEKQAGINHAKNCRKYKELPYWIRPEIRKVLSEISAIFYFTIEKHNF